MKRLARLLSLALALALAACSSPSAPGGPSLTETGAGPAPSADHPPIDPSKRPVTSASPQRLSVAALRRSFPIVMGKDGKGDGITWKFGPVAGLDKLADALGEADFTHVTEDNLDPSPLYLKFMDDAARDVCERALTADYNNATMSSRTLLRFVATGDTSTSNAAGFDKNVRYLELRFHGVKVADGDDAPIAPYRTLFDAAVSAAAAGSPVTPNHVKEGWRVVCVALVTAPEFHLY